MNWHDRGHGPLRFCFSSLDIEGLIVPEGHVLMLGDHRGNSRDGRYFGTVPVSELYGRAVGVFWTMNEGLVWKGL